MSRLETVESEEERWAEDRLLSSRGGRGGWRGVGVVYTGRWAGPPSPRYRVRPGSSSVLGRPPAREGLFLALCDNFQEDTYHQQLVAGLLWLCDAVTDEREFSWCGQSSRRWAQILTKEVKKFLFLPSPPLSFPNFAKVYEVCKKMSSIYSQVTRKINPFQCNGATQNSTYTQNILCSKLSKIRSSEFSANTQPSCFSGWSQKIPRDERVGECETAAKCRSHSKSSSPPVSSSKSPERQTRNRQHRQKVTQPLIYEMSKPVSSNHSYYWEGLRPKITPRPKPYSDRTAIKFTSKVDFNLLGSPFRYLERSQNLGGHDSELIGGKQMIFPARFCGRNQQFPVFTCQNLDNLELN